MATVDRFDSAVGPATHALPGQEPVFDGAVLGDFLGDDAAAIAGVLQTFLASIVQTMDAVQAAADKPDLPKLAELAHRAKGAAMVSGATALALAAHQLEHAAQTLDVSQSLLATGQLQLQWQCLENDRQLRDAVAKR